MSDPLKTMILAAGFGTRLRPLTCKRPKALMPVVNRPVIEWTVEYLQSQGVGEIVVNAHHHAGRICEYLARENLFGPRIEVRVEPEILGTGGGLRNTADFWGEDPFVVINGDVLTDIDLAPALEHHRRSGALATLILHDCEPFNQIELAPDGGILDIAPGRAAGRRAFTGIHIMEPRLLRHIPEGQYSDIVDSYRRLMASGERIQGYVSEGHYWRDIGTPESYLAANRERLSQDAPLALGADCRVSPSVRFEGWAVVGAGAVLAEDVEIARSVLWEEVRVEAGSRIQDSVVTDARVVSGDLIHKFL